VVLAAAALTMGLVAGCGDDEETSSEEAFCAAGDSLESNVDGLGDIDIVAGGTNALDAQFDAIKSDLEDLRSSGSDVAADEIAALDAAVDQLEADLDALGDDVTAEGASAVGDSVNSVVAAARTVRDTLETTCP
jgi:outer membrane murein-binding lipoprotein Lpp